MKRSLLLLSLIIMITSCAPKESSREVYITPYPNDIEVFEGTFCVAGSNFYCDPAIDQATQSLITKLYDQVVLISNNTTSNFEVSSKTGRGVIFKLDKTIAPEAYQLRVTEKRVVVKASNLNGFNYAIQTIKQLLPAAIFGSVPAPDADWSIPCLKIDDAPRFGYRGLHLDVSRHFFTVEEVKRYIDVIELHKMNKFHWHLTDDQGWRIEIKKYPKLTEVGANRSGTMILKDWDSNDRVPYGGFYTQEEIKEVVEYAAAKGITIIPEIDLPGHMLAALASYPELGCTGGPYEVWTRWGIADDVLCVGKEETFKFLEGVLDEIVALFPSEYIHIGGDECPKVRWETCPDCQAKIEELGLKDDDKHKAEHYLQSYVTRRMEEYLAKYDRKIIGWDEILEGELAPNATVMSWRGTKGGETAVKMGHDAIMTPYTYYYLDYYQSKDIENEPFGIGGYLPVEVCYSYEPFTEEMTPEDREHILGVQANLWTEYIATFDHLTYMLLPRASALSEVQWCQPEVKDYDRFLRTKEHLASIYEAMGLNYAKHIYQEK